MTGPNSLTLNDGKAGMQGLDKEKINKIIRESSKGSKFYQHAEKKEKQLKSKIDKMLEERAALTNEDLQRGTAHTDDLLACLEAARDVTRHIVHVDMDAFYAAVEMRDNPSLKDVPMAVGSSAMLSTSNYLARRFGVRAAMPGFIAKKLCPGLVIVPGNHDKYKVVSNQIMEVIRKYTEEYSAASLDEVYCDLTEAVSLRQLSRTDCPLHCQPQCSTLTQHTDANELKEALCWCTSESVVKNIVSELRADIQATTQLTASAGISCNTFLAKVCSDLNKPNGQYQLPPQADTILDFSSQLAVKKVPGIGPVQCAMLAALDIVTVADIVEQRRVLWNLFTLGSVEFYMSRALGVGSNRLDCSDGGRSSMSTETTFSATPVNAPNGELTASMVDLLSELSETLSQRLQVEKLAGETVTVKLKLSSFQVLQRSKTVDYTVSSKRDIELIATEMLKHLVREKACSPQAAVLSDQPASSVLSARLLGVRVSNFVSQSSGSQPSILSFVCDKEKKKEKWECPVCGLTLPPQLVAFNKHLDNCILASDVDTENKKSSEHELVSDSGGGGMAAIGSTTTPVSSNQYRLLESGVRSEENHVYFSGDNKEDEKKKEKWECPVCGLTLPPQLVAFNKHLDNCILTSDVENKKSSELGTENRDAGNSVARKRAHPSSQKPSKCSKNLQNGPLLKYFKPA